MNCRGRHGHESDCTRTNLPRQTPAGIVRSATRHRSVCHGVTLAGRRSIVVAPYMQVLPIKGQQLAEVSTTAVDSSYLLVRVSHDCHSFPKPIHNTPTESVVSWCVRYTERALLLERTRRSAPACSTAVPDGTGKRCPFRPVRVTPRAFRVWCFIDILPPLSCPDTLVSASCCACPISYARRVFPLPSRPTSRTVFCPTLVRC